MDKRLKVDQLELILSTRLTNILKEVNHKIAHELLETSTYKKSDVTHKVTFIDLSIDSNMVTFIASNKVPDLIDQPIVHGGYHREFETDSDGIKRFVGGYYDYIPTYRNPFISDQGHVLELHDKQFSSKDHQVWKKNRSEISIQRVVNKIWPNRFPVNHTRIEADNMKILDDVESFGNMYIATVEAHSKQFQLKSGRDISHFYKMQNYAKVSGNLGSSCMRQNNMEHFFSIYVNNPDKVQMLVLFPEDVRDKIIGRAIVWKLDGQYEGRYFMDRIYVANDSDQYMFIEYAKLKGWLYKSTQSHGSSYDIVDTNDNSKKQMHLSVDLVNMKHEYYPYMDTMQFYNPSIHNITNNVNFARKKGGYRVCTSTGGGSDVLHS